MPAAGRRRHPGRQDPAAAQARPAPDFTNNQRWFNTPGDQPLRWRGSRPCRARGLLDLHLHQLHPHAARSSRACTPTTTRMGWRSWAWRPRSSPSNRRPPTSNRRSTPTGLRYPVVQDNRYGTWNAYQNQYWPAEYLIDAERPGPPHPVRRGELQAGRGGRARAALRGGRSQPPAPDDGHRDHALLAPRHPGDLPQPRSAPRDSRRSCRAAPTSTRASTPRSSTSSGCTAPGTPPRNRSRRPPSGASITGALPGRPRLPGDDLQRQQAAHRPGAASTASRSRPRKPAQTSTTAS